MNKQSIQQEIQIIQNKQVQLRTTHKISFSDISYVFNQVMTLQRLPISSDQKNGLYRQMLQNKTQRIILEILKLEDRKQAILKQYQVTSQAQSKPNKPKVPTFQEDDECWTGSSRSVSEENSEPEKPENLECEFDSFSLENEVKQQQQQTIVQKEEKKEDHKELSSRLSKKLQQLEHDIYQIYEELQLKNQAILGIAQKMCVQIIKMDESIFKNRQSLIIAGAVIYYGSIYESSPISTRKIAKIIDCKEKTLNKIYMILKQNLVSESNNNNNNCNNNNNNGLAENNLPIIYIRKIVQNLKIKEEMLPQMEQVLNILFESQLLDGEQNSTVGSCAVALWFQINAKTLSFKQIATAGGVCEISLRNLNKKLMPHLESLRAKYAQLTQAI